MSKFADMMSLDELQITFPLLFVPKIHQMTSYPETLTSYPEKVDQDEVSYF